MTDANPREDRPTMVMPMCPMAETCKRMMDNPPSRFLMFLPGVVFIVVGLVIIAVPSILVWLIAAASIVMGTAMLGCAYFMRTVKSRLRRTDRYVAQH